WLAWKTTWCSENRAQLEGPTRTPTLAAVAARLSASSSTDQPPRSPTTNRRVAGAPRTGRARPRPHSATPAGGRSAVRQLIRGAPQGTGPRHRRAPGRESRRGARPAAPQAWQAPPAAPPRTRTEALLRPRAPGGRRSRRTRPGARTQAPRAARWSTDRRGS